MFVVLSWFSIPIPERFFQNRCPIVLILFFLDRGSFFEVCDTTVLAVIKVRWRFFLFGLFSSFLPLFFCSQVQHFCVGSALSIQLSLFSFSQNY